MIVLDASVVVDFLLGVEPRFGVIAKRVARTSVWCAPHLVDAEVAQVVRRFALDGDITEERAEAALDDLAALPLSRYPLGPFVKRAFEFRHNVTVYDGLYLALAEGLRAPLLTLDSALTRIPGHRAKVELL